MNLFQIVRINVHTLCILNWTHIFKLNVWSDWTHPFASDSKGEEIQKSSKYCKKSNKKRKNWNKNIVKNFTLKIEIVVGKKKFAFIPRVYFYLSCSVYSFVWQKTNRKKKYFNYIVIMFCHSLIKWKENENLIKTKKWEISAFFRVTFDPSVNVIRAAEKIRAKQLKSECNAGNFQMIEWMKILSFKMFVYVLYNFK